MHHYSESDHEWLLYRTWIDWYIIDDKGNHVLLWDPARDGTKRSELILRRRENGSFHVVRPEGGVDEYDTGEGKGSPEEPLDEDNDSEESDTNDGLELLPCPQYGWPGEDNLYGRLAWPHHPGTLPSKPASTTVPKSGSLQIGTLRFQTISARYKIGSSRTGSILNSMNRSRTLQTEYFTLFDREGRVCGIIWDHGILTVEASSLSTEAEILLLSYAAPGTKDPFDALELKLPPFYQEASASDQHTDRQRILGQWHVWDMFNVMLVIPNTRQSLGQAVSTGENGGIGLLHKKALEYALAPAPCWKETYLS